LVHHSRTIFCRAVPNLSITIRNCFIAVQEAGHWVLLQNCHLAASWLPTLDKKVAAAAAAAAGGGSGPRPHGNYRLWLTAFPTASFPVGVLQVRGTTPLRTALQRDAHTHLPAWRQRRAPRGRRPARRIMSDCAATGLNSKSNLVWDLINPM
jgi:hypothetical protein